MNWAYYNEIDGEKAAWLRELIRQGHIAPGDVDERSIKDVRPDDVRGYVQCHWFAGVGVWSYALRLAGWPDDRPVWTGSCPCPSFSCAGKGEGFDDPRHLWPDWARLIRECRPATVFGEQVNAAVGHGWLDLVYTDLEAAGYAVGAAVLGAHSVGAPHIRQRLYFAGELCQPAEGRQRQGRAGLPVSGQGPCGAAERSGDAGSTSDTAETGGDSHALSPRLQRLAGDGSYCGQPRWLSKEQARFAAETGSTRDFWRDCDWWYGRDNKYRPIEPGLQPLAHGAPARVGRLRGYGDCIVPQVAEAFIRAYCEVRK